MKRTFTRISSLALISVLPLLAFAQDATDLTTGTGSGNAAGSSVGTAQDLFQYGLEILNDYIVPVIFALAFAMFIFNIYRYFIAGGASEEKVAEGRKFLMWSIIGFVIMFSIWGIINVFVNTLGFNSVERPALPKFGAPVQTSSSDYGSGSDYGDTGSSDGSDTGTTLVNGVAMQNVVPMTSGGLCPSGYTPNSPNCYLTAASSGTPQAGTGQGNGTVTQGGQCVTNDDCAGNLACSDNHVCTIDGDLEGPGYGDGDGTVTQGGACEDSQDCSGNLICTSGVCAIDSQLDAGNGTQGSACQNSDQCNDNLECINSVCSVDNGLGQTGEQCSSDDDCSGNLACINGSCQVDSQLDSGDGSDSGDSGGD